MKPSLFPNEKIEDRIQAERKAFCLQCRKDNDYGADVCFTDCPLDEIDEEDD